MKNHKEILIKFYDETYKKLEAEKKKYKMFKEVIETFEVIQNHAKKMKEELEKEDTK